MQATALTIDQVPQQPPNVVRFGMLTFLASEAMLFAGLIGGYIVLRSGAGGGWQMPEALKNPVTMGQTLAATACLLSSSFTLHFGEVRLLRGQRGGRWLLFLTVVLGSLFLTNQVHEWVSLYHEGFWFNTAGIMGSSFFVLTGFHGLHVAIGALLLIAALVLWLLFPHFASLVFLILVLVIGFSILDRRYPPGSVRYWR